MNGNRKKHIFAMIAWALAAAFVLAGCGIGSGTGTGTEDAPVASASDGSSGGLIVSSDEASSDSGKKISFLSAQVEEEDFDDYGISPIASTVYTVTATVEGIGLAEEQKSVTWEKPSFNNRSSAWAKGKNVSNYLKTTSSGNQITVECLQPFGEQIVVPVHVTSCPDVTAVLNLDYEQKLDYDFRMTLVDVIYKLPRTGTVVFEPFASLSDVFTLPLEEFSLPGETFFEATFSLHPHFLDFVQFMCGGVWADESYIYEMINYNEVDFGCWESFYFDINRFWENVFGEEVLQNFRPSIYHLMGMFSSEYPVLYVTISVSRNGKEMGRSEPLPVPLDNTAYL